METSTKAKIIQLIMVMDCGLIEIFLIGQLVLGPVDKIFLLFLFIAFYYFHITSLVDLSVCLLKVVCQQILQIFNSVFRKELTYFNALETVNTFQYASVIELPPRCLVTKRTKNFLRRTEKMSV